MLNKYFLNSNHFYRRNSNYYIKFARIQILQQEMSIQNEIQGEVESIQSKFKQNCNMQGSNKRKTGCWSREQQKKYIQFLSFFRKSLQSRQQRKNNKVFKQMAEYIGSRDGIQCRSHHIKQLRTHKQVRRIIENYQQINDIVQLGCKDMDLLKNSSQEKYQQNQNKKIKLQDSDLVQVEQNTKFNFTNTNELLFMESFNWFHFYPHFQDHCQQFYMVFILPDQSLGQKMKLY